MSKLEVTGVLAELVRRGGFLKKEIDRLTKELKDVKAQLAGNESVIETMDIEKKGTVTLDAGGILAKVTVPTEYSIEEDKAAALREVNEVVYFDLVKEVLVYKVDGKRTKEFSGTRPWIWEYVDAVSGKPKVEFSRSV